MRKLLALVAIGCLLPMAASAGTIEYVGSSTVGKFITDASKVYLDSVDTIRQERENIRCDYH